MNGNKESDLVITPEGGVEELPVSMQLYQAIYNDITGKTEKITDTYDCFYRVTIDDIKNLDARVYQFCEQYNVSSQNASVVIFHANGSKERFSSLSRLNAYNVANTNPIERIVIEFNFLIVLPKVSRPQNYKLKITLVSGIAIVEKNEKDMPAGLPVRILMRAVQRETAEVEVEYVDYMVARSMSDLLRDWIKSLPSVTANESIRWWQSVSHVIRQFIAAIFLVGATYVALQYSDIYFTSARVGSSYLVKYLIFSFVFGWFVFAFGGYVGGRVEQSIDGISHNAYSVICGNAGDKKLVDKFDDKFKKSKWKVFVEIILTFVVGVCSSLFAAYILG